MESSKLYTFQKPTQSKRKYVGSTIVITLLSIIGGLGIDYALNPKGIAAMFSVATTSGNSNTGSATGDAIDYQYGTVQLKVTKTSGKISAIDLVQAGATAGREQAFPTLVDAAISANGTSFGNLGGATYTTEAFKTALDSALSKLG